MISTVLFDLDGTLVDTAPDLGYALNLQLQHHGRPTLSDEIIRPVASHGSRGLLGLGFGITPEDANFAAMRAEYLDIYDQVFARSPKLFDGMEDVLQTIESKKLNWGIVTNKPRRFTQPMVQNLGLMQRAVCVISGDDAPRPKPAPDTLMMACNQAKVQPAQCVYVGDAERDIEAGIAAGMKTAVALFGYLDTSDSPHQWGADALIRTPHEILTLI